MRGTLKVAKWEVGRNLRNKQFLLGLLITPLLIALFAGLPQLLERWNQPSVSTYLVYDEVDGLGLLEGQNLGNLELIPYTLGRDSLEETVLEEGHAGYFVLDESFLTSGAVEVYRNERNHETLATLTPLISGVLQQIRIQEAQINPEKLVYLTQPAQIRAIQMEDTDVANGNSVIVSMVAVGLLFFMIFGSGTMLMQSALQEKRDRMAEVVLSSVRPSDLMQGKIIGHFLLGLIQLGAWLALGLPMVIYLLEFPVMEALADTNLLFLAVFGLLGYLLFAALFVGMGATMEDLQSAGNAQSMMIMIPMLSFLFLGPVVSNPDGVISRFASLFPLTSPTIMIIRNAITSVPRWEVVTSLILLLATAVLLTRLSAKIFRVGMLMYGKSASLPEMYKWLRHKDA